MNNPLISIVTPCYNGLRYLPELKDSIIGQTYENWEWLIVDDCSSDGSYNYLFDLAQADSRIIPIRHEENMGAAEARNTAIARARGTFLAFIDADDLWHPDKLAAQLEFMQRNQYNFTYTSFSRFKGSPSASDKPIRVPDRTGYKNLIINTIIATSTVMLNVERLGKFRMKPVYYDDFVLWLDLLRKEPYAYGLNKCLMNYRISDNSLSRNKLNSAKKVYEIFTKNLGLGYFKARWMFCLWSINAVFRYIRYYS